MPKHGDKRKDGYKFWGVHKETETWLSPKAWNKSVALSASRGKERAARSRRDPKFRKHLNRELRKWLAANPKRMLLYKAKERALKNGLAFDLTPEDFTIPTRCPVLGVVLKRNRKAVHAASPTLDRIRPTKGYVRGNIIVVCHKVNTIKSNATPEELLRVGKFYKQLWRR